ncbi:hypothetical protein HMPREF0005_01194 [Achromobacter xylosoxidans C54]|uniref:ATP-binding protein n=1 Tax=Alcaligenes xylosoxydans xylosoxydans TaxID=85698 RepID=UPI0001F4223A|nr:ATP-binding protein [Achromobacter xylosoxidans]EFV81834.1 hypothetical protein HMPREF0005_01194 [Achromobacter xylosoxidans C54]
MSMNGVEVIPSAKRLIRSLRDMGYEFAAAVADLIDNSIEARANTVRLDVEWNGEDSYVMIADNGVGMSASQLREALRFGAERDYDTEDLGKFGLGLKTASLSQCLRLTVASRQNEGRADINAYCWDLGHIEATNRWEILPVKSIDLQPQARQHLKETTGTVVIWERLDRILGYKRPDGEMARKQLTAMCRALEEHVAMVFHRFLEGAVRGKRLAIYLNGNKVVPWDPFARAEGNTQKLEPVVLRIEQEKGKSDVVLEPYVLPAQAKFSSPEAFSRASGPNKWNRQQGFYIYRADRMIQSGGWSNLRTLDEHNKLARVALYFSPKLDEEFKINVPKMRVVLPAAIRDDMLKAIGPVVKLANAAYRAGEKGIGGGGVSPRPKTPPPPSVGTSREGGAASGGASSNVGTSPSPNPAGTPSPSASEGGRGNGTGGGTNGSSVDLEHIESLLERVARPDEWPVVQRVVARAKQTFTG